MIGDRLTFEDENQPVSRKPEAHQKSSGLTALMIGAGFAKSPQQAVIIQIGACVLLLTVAVVLFAKKPNTERYGNYDEMKLEHPELFVD